MFPRLLIPTMLAALTVAFLADCAPSSDNRHRVEASASPKSEKIESKPQELMAVGGELVLYQADVRHYA